MADVLDTLNKLPEMCAATLPGTKDAILIRRGVKGYWPAPRPDMDVAAYNERKGVTPAQVEAMIVGSMFGWDCPGADPDNCIGFP